MKIIFLDIDGVLNNWYTEEKVVCKELSDEDEYTGIDPVLLNNFVKIIKETDAKVVLSSTWREFDELYSALVQKFEQKGIKDCIIGKTLCFSAKRSTSKRCHEIRQWLDENKSKVDKFIIIDDLEEADTKDAGAFFQTTGELGLTEDLADAIINYLN